MIKEIRIGTRSSILARQQTDFIIGLLRTAWPGLSIKVEVITTQGDIMQEMSLSSLGGKGVFTKEIEKALLMEQIDLAVHSLKDLPVTEPEGLVVGAIPPRTNPADVLVSREGVGLAELPVGARIGTSSLRRAAQLRHFRDDLQVIDIRGNIDTRLKKTFSPNGAYDACVVAFAALERIALLEYATEIFPLDFMLPAPGQAALAVQCRNASPWLDLLAPLHHTDTSLSVRAERSFLQGLGGGCALPVAAHAEISDGNIVLQGRVTSQDGSCQLDLMRTASLLSGDHALIARQLGLDLAQEAILRGAHDLLCGEPDA